MVWCGERGVSCGGNVAVGKENEEGVVLWHGGGSGKREVKI